MNKFTEEKLEHAFIELLRNEGYPHHLGNTITRNTDEVIEEDLINYLLAKYKSKQLTYPLRYPHPYSFIFQILK